ncbi:hypothetical protein AGDE_14953 [Angomonas deanei]|nr:hypothetical protein AGDE_14953 [Angomonas deanei]|eukprot:EPY19933.1 hypothetical protein AGDE_14953 [Angomonas deanei]
MGAFLQLVFHFEKVKRRLCTLAVAKQVAGREGPVHLWGDGSFSSLHVPLTEKRNCLGEDLFLYDCLTKRSCARDALDYLVTSPSSEETDVMKEILRLLSRILSADVL